MNAERNTTSGRQRFAVTPYTPEVVSGKLFIEKTHIKKNILFKELKVIESYLSIPH